MELEVGKVYEFKHPNDYFKGKVISDEEGVYLVAIIEGDHISAGRVLHILHNSRSLTHYKVTEYKEVIDVDYINYKDKPYLYDLHVNMAIDSNDQDWLLQLVQIKKSGVFR